MTTRVTKALVSRLSRLRRSTLALARTPLTKSEEKERLLAVYSLIEKKAWFDPVGISVLHLCLNPIFGFFVTISSLSCLSESYLNKSTLIIIQHFM